MSVHGHRVSLRVNKNALKLIIIIVAKSYTRIKVTGLCTLNKCTYMLCELYCNETITLKLIDLHAFLPSFYRLYFACERVKV